AEFLPWAYRVYGYRYIPKQAGLPPRVEVHPEQANVVRDMFRWLIEEQLTTRQIVKRLNALKIPTRTGQNPVVGHCHCASTIRGQFRRCTTHQSRYNARVGRLFAPCIVREMLSRITSDPLQCARYQLWSQNDCRPRPASATRSRETRQ